MDSFALVPRITIIKGIAAKSKAAKTPRDEDITVLKIKKNIPPNNTQPVQD
ncbi:MAG: hypothetical protein IGS39_02115 [Calothrix sp. C42_A2020_038]|nr:hypothetical protein [Calothrix sp. C42_A2020_038]